jgi:hypothetical protein
MNLQAVALPLLSITGTRLIDIEKETKALYDTTMLFRAEMAWDSAAFVCRCI